MPRFSKLPPDVRAKILKRAAAGRDSFDVFIDLIWKYTPLRHQKRWLKALKKVVAGELTELLLVAPRGSGKSALIGVLFLAWTIGNNPTKHYGLISYADKIAWRRARAIRNVIEFNPVYRLIFPDVRPDKSNWSRDSFTVKRPDTTDLHPTLIAAGSTSAVISSRLDGLVYDDPHDEKNSKTPSKRRAVVETHDTAIFPCLVENAWTVCIATRYAADDLPGVFINRGFEYMRQRAIVSHVNPKTHKRTYHSYAPKLRSLASLRKEQERNPAAFALQMQGDVKGGKAAVIKKIVTYQAKDLPDLKMLHIGAGTDTNYKDSEANDYNVIYVGGLDVKGNIWLLDRVKIRCDVYELADIIIALHKTWHYFTNWIEDTSKGTPAVTVVRRKAAATPCDLQNPSTGGKRSRASALAPYLNTGQVRFPAGAEWLQDAEYYLTGYGHVEFDDDVDSLYMLVSNLLTCIHPKNYGKNRPKKRLRMR